MIFVLLTMNMEFMFKSENDTSLAQVKIFILKKITCRTREIIPYLNASHNDFFFLNYIFWGFSSCIFQRLYVVYNTQRNVKFDIATDYFPLCTLHL